MPWLIQAFSPNSSWLATAILWVRWPLFIVFGILALALIYRFGPARKKPAWRWITPGSLFATFTWLVASGAFVFYTAHFGSYNKTYGTLGAIVGFMTWIWVSAIVVMVGAEINAETEREAKGDKPNADKSHETR
jgi:membrane protein